MRHLFKVIRLALAILGLLAFVGVGAIAFSFFAGVDLNHFLPKPAFELFEPVKRAGSVLTGSIDRLVPDSFKQSLKKLPQKHILATVVLVADSHNENDQLAKALSQAKQKGASLIIGLGDYTDVGTYAELSKAKNTLTAADLPFYALPGDHDLWAGREASSSAEAIYAEVFGTYGEKQHYQEFDYGGAHFLLVDNADNELGLDASQWAWLVKATPKGGSSLTFVLAHATPYHPYSEHVMGRVKQEVAKQAQELRELLGKSQITGLIAGDLHYFAAFTDEQFGTTITTVGAVAQKRNAQKPRYALLRIYDDKSYKIEDVEIE